MKNIIETLETLGAKKWHTTSGLNRLYLNDAFRKLCCKVAYGLDEEADIPNSMLTKWKEAKVWIDLNNDDVHDDKVQYDGSMSTVTSEVISMLSDPTHCYWDFI